MKTKFTLFALLFTLIGFAQNGINYKAIIKDDLGNVLANTFMSVQFTIHSVSETGAIVYQEDHNALTDDNGLIILSIGTDTGPSVGVFDEIDWSANLHFLQTSITYSAGTIDFDATQFMAVPYALHAKTADITGDESVFDDWDKDVTDDFDGQYSSLSGKPNNTISIPAFAMAIDPGSSIITQDRLGLKWQNNFSSPAQMAIKKPDDYSGGDVEFSIFFFVSTSSSGQVEFFIRPRSFNNLNSFTDASSLPVEGVLVSPTTGFGRLYELNYTIPASRLTNDWWYISIQRNIASLTDDVIVMSAALTY